MSTLDSSPPVQHLPLDPYYLAYRDWGGPGPAVVFLHGFMATQRVWDPLVGCLRGQCRPITLDLLGFGASSQPAIRYDIATEVGILERFIQHLQITDGVLVGHSFGGWVASAYAIAHPLQMQGLVLLAPAGIRDDRFAGRYRWLMPLLWQSPWVDRLLHWGSPLAWSLGQAQPWQQLKTIRQQLQDQPVARQFLQARQRPEAAVDTVEENLAQISIPTLVVAAGQDDTIPLWHCQTYAAGIPNAHFHVLPQTPHALPEHPEAVAPLLRAFLLSLKA